MDDNVSLKEYFERIISDLEEKFNTAETANETALKIQAIETERRLDALNGEAGRINIVLSTTIPREVHERDMKEVRSLIDVLTLAGKDYVTKEYVAGLLKTPTDEIKGLTSTSDVLAGRASQQSVDKASSRADYSLALALVGSLIGIIAFIKGFIK